MPEPKDPKETETEIDTAETAEPGGLEIKGASVSKLKEAAEAIEDTLAAQPDDAEQIEDVEDAIEDLEGAAVDVVDAPEEAAKEIAEDVVDLLDQAEAADEASGEAPAEDDVIDIPGAADAPDAPAATVTPPPAAPQAVKKVGFFPVLMGGVVAAALGALALYYADREGWLNLGGGAGGPEIAALQEELAALRSSSEAEIAALKSALAAVPTEAPAPVDLAPLEGSIAALNAVDADTSTAVQELAKALADTRARLGELEVQPIAKADLPDEIASAYEAQLAEVLAGIETRFTEMQTAQGAVVTRIETDLQAQLAAIEAAQAEASATEEAARLAAVTAAAEAASARISVALDSGAGFAEPLATIEEKAGIAAPAALTAVAADGAPSPDALKEAFPVAARTVLTETSRDAAADGSISPLTSFILTQLGARSLEPREGNDPDAILSRAEAALSQGDLDTALAEVAALPDAAQTVFADWTAQATTLRDAKAAAADLAAQINAK